MPALLPRAIAFRRPGSGHGPAADAAGRGLRTGLGTSPAVIPTHFVVGIHGGTRVELARLRSLATRACALRAKRPA